MKKKNEAKNKTEKQNKNNPQDNFDWRRASKTSFLWIFIIFGAVYISSMLTENGKKEIEIEYTEYRKYLQNGDILKAVIIGDVFHGEFRLPQSIVTPMGNTLDDISHFKLTLPFIDRENTIEWDNAGFEYTFKEKWFNTIYNWIRI